MKFYMPDWNDRVDPNFDFVADQYAPNRDLSKDLYAHEVFDLPPYDGILISRAVVERSNANYLELQKKGAQKYFRLHEGMEVFGDCGAFSYVNEEKPWYEVEDVLEYYDAIGVDYGVSVDHLVVDTFHKNEIVEVKDVDGRVVRKEKKKTKVKMDDGERQRRRNLTLRNARKFLELYNRGDYQFEPVGVAQGWSPLTYANSTKKLIEIGYDHIALGGLARSGALLIIEVLKKVKKVIDNARLLENKEIKLHLFGVAKLGIINQLPEYGVTSIDSASYLRKAWLRSGQNFLTTDGEWYTAIRVPQSYNPKVIEYVKQNGSSLNIVRKQESKILKQLQKLGNQPFSDKKLDVLMDAIVEYDSYLLRLGDDGQLMRDTAISRDRYLRTLKARPWENCTCEICQEIGIHVVIFRGTNRNKRRGFHNTWAFHKELEKIR